jgi:acyl carrier protein
MGARLIDVCAVIEKETGQKVTPETMVKELGLDSLEFLDLLLTLQGEADKTIPDEKVAYLETVSDLIESLA